MKEEFLKWFHSQEGVYPHQTPMYLVDAFFSWFGDVTLDGAAWKPPIPYFVKRAQGTTYTLIHIAEFLIKKEYVKTGNCGTSIVFVNASATIWKSHIAGMHSIFWEDHLMGIRAQIIIMDYPLSLSEKQSPSVVDNFHRYLEELPIPVFYTTSKEGWA